MVLVWRQNYLQTKAMLNAALHNPNLSETERAAVKAHAQTRGLAAALGLLGGMVTAAAERMRKQEERAEQLAAAYRADSERIRAAADEIAGEKRLDYHDPQPPKPTPSATPQQGGQTEPLDSATRSYTAWAKAVEEGKFDSAAYGAWREEMWSPSCTVDNPYGLPPATRPALDWLINLYRNDQLPGNTALERTQYILEATKNGWFTHFDMKRIPFGDSGFALRYQDSTVWKGSSNQVGHFLTAVDISIGANSSPVPLITRFLGQSAVLGHEMLGDDVTPPFIPHLGHLVQIGYGARSLILSGGKVSEWMCSQKDEDLDKILSYGPLEKWDYLHHGNSKEDLRLTCEGWVIGEKIVNGEFHSSQELGDYLEERLKK